MRQWLMMNDCCWPIHYVANILKVCVCPLVRLLVAGCSRAPHTTRINRAAEVAMLQLNSTHVREQCVTRKRKLR